MSGKKCWLRVIVCTGLVLNGCAGMSKNQAALVGAATCGAMGAAGGGVAANNNVEGNHIPIGAGVAIGLVTGALLCGGLAYLIAQTEAEAGTTAAASATASAEGGAYDHTGRRVI
jgi:hypothetical protein